MFGNKGLQPSQETDGKLNINVSNFPIGADTETGILSIDSVLKEIRDKQNKSVESLPLSQQREIVRNRFLASETVLMDGRLSDGWTKLDSGVLSADTSKKENGVSSLKLAPSAGSSLYAVKTSAWDFSDVGNFRLWAACDDVAKLEIFDVLVEAPDAANRFRIRLKNDLVTRWNGPCEIGLSKAEFTVENGAPDWSNVKRIMIHVRGVAGQSPVVWVDNLKAQKSVVSKGKVLIRFDDNNLTDYSVAFQLMQQHGIVGSCVVVPTWNTETRTTLEQMKEMQTWGWDICSHSWLHHDFGGKTYTQAYNDLRATKGWLLSNGFEKGARTHAYPFHHQTPDTLKAANDLFILNSSGRNTHECLPFGDPLNLKWLAGSAQTFETLKKHVDECAKHKTLAIITFHPIGTTSGISVTTEAFTQFIEYVASSNVDSITYSDLIDGTEIALR